MADVVQHRNLLSKIEKAFPEQDRQSCLQIYESVLKCVRRKKYVSNSQPLQYITPTPSRRPSPTPHHMLLPALRPSQAPPHHVHLTFDTRLPVLENKTLFHLPFKIFFSSCSRFPFDACNFAGTQAVLCHSLSDHNFLRWWRWSWYWSCNTESLVERYVSLVLVFALWCVERNIMSWHDIDTTIYCSLNSHGENIWSALPLIRIIWDR